MGLIDDINDNKVTKPLLEKLLEDLPGDSPEAKEKHERWSRILATFAEDIADDISSSDSLELMVMSVAAAVAYVKQYRKTQRAPHGKKTH